MERASFEQEKNGIVYKLPIGFRFQPTDEELLVHYLKRKVFSQPLPVSVIPDLDVFHLNPWDLPGCLRDKRYFFCKKKMNFMSKCSSNFSTGCGHWKGSNKEKQILGNNLVIGIRKSYVFHQAKKNSGGLKSEWVLQEFCIVGSISTPYLNQKIMVQVGDWVACRVYQRKTKSRNGVKSNKTEDLGVSLPQIGSCSSGLTEIMCNDLDQEVISPQVK
ncbi:NAC domain protein [Striga asiatica]|uniref:NAC domain protein n=1 Tax=Striga asiatica TaxID=4170 RepID=A0A5A7Q177_STRAF|nr:NAC domain protein [Striga asiatica]